MPPQSVSRSFSSKIVFPITYDKEGNDKPSSFYSPAHTAAKKRQRRHPTCSIYLHCISHNPIPILLWACASGVLLSNLTIPWCDSFLAQNPKPWNLRKACCKHHVCIKRKLEPCITLIVLFIEKEKKHEPLAMSYLQEEIIMMILCFRYVEFSDHEEGGRFEGD